MYTMILVPDADGYSSTDGTEWVRSELDGGVGRYRQDKIGASKMVSVKWTLSPYQYQYWRSFYALVGSRTFLCKLVSEDASGPALHECNIIPGSVSLPGQQGLTYVHQCQLEVKPLPRDPEFDEGLVLIYGESNGNPDAWISALAMLVNDYMPAIGEV